MSHKSRETLRQVDKITGWFGAGDVAASYNGIGLRLTLFGGYRWRLYSHQHMAFQDNFISLSAFADASPATANLGAVLKIQPTSFFFFGGSYKYRFYLPTFSSGTVFSDQTTIDRRFEGNASYLDGENRLDRQLRDMTALNEGRVFVHGHTAEAYATLQLKVANIVFVASGMWLGMWFRWQDKNNSQFFYEALADLIAAKTEHQFDLNMIAGYQWRQFFFLLISSSTYLLNSQAIRSLLGPALLWEFTPRWLIFQRPSVLLAVRWHLVHLWRVGAMPNIGIVFAWKFE